MLYLIFVISVREILNYFNPLTPIFHPYRNLSFGLQCRSVDHFLYGKKNILKLESLFKNGSSVKIMNKAFY